jgi:uncharacterized protein with PIN domain
MGPRFILDGMLGKLSRWLRISGYNAKYVGTYDDAEILVEASREELILLTKDKLLFRKAQKLGLDGLLVEGVDYIEELAFVAKQFGLKLDPKKSRCPCCGEPVQEVSKESLVNKIPSRSLKHYEIFWSCKACGKVFWRGSHWKNILETIEKASEKAGQ